MYKKTSYADLNILEVPNDNYTQATVDQRKTFSHVQYYGYLSVS